MMNFFVRFLMFCLILLKVSSVDKEINTYFSRYLRSKKAKSPLLPEKNGIFKYYPEPIDDFSKKFKDLDNWDPSEKQKMLSPRAIKTKMPTKEEKWELSKKQKEMLSTNIKTIPVG